MARHNISAVTHVDSPIIISKCSPQTDTIQNDIITNVYNMALDCKIVVKLVFAHLTSS